MLIKSACLLYSYALMLRCWDVEPTQRPLFCELSSIVAIIIAKMKAATAATAERRASETASGLRPVGYVNTVNSAPVEDYLRPFDDRTIAEPADCGRRLDLPNSVAAAQDVDDDGDLADFHSEVVPSDGTDDQDNRVL